MSPLLVINKIRNAGGSVWGEDGDLRIEAPVGLLTPEDKSVLTQFKTDLVPLLARPMQLDDPDEREAIVWAETAPAEEVDQALDRALVEYDHIVGEELVVEDLDQWLADNTIEPISCDDCGGLERWEDIAGGWHCNRCDPPLRAQTLRLQVARLRRLTRERVLMPIPEQDLPRPLVGTGELESPCPYCGAGLYYDVAIHRGHSVRRDCRYCGRFLVFVRWNDN